MAMEKGGKSRGQGKSGRGRERETPGEATTQHSGQCAVSAVGDGRSRSAVEGRKGGSRYDKGIRDEQGSAGGRGELQVVGGRAKDERGCESRKEGWVPESSVTHPPT